MHSDKHNRGLGASQRYEIEKEIVEAYASLERLAQQLGRDEKVVSIGPWKAFAEFKAAIESQLEAARALSRI